MNKRRAVFVLLIALAGAGCAELRELYPVSVEAGALQDSAPIPAEAQWAERIVADDADRTVAWVPLAIRAVTLVAGLTLQGQRIAVNGREILQIALYRGSTRIPLTGLAVDITKRRWGEIAKAAVWVTGQAAKHGVSVTPYRAAMSIVDLLVKLKK